MKRILHLKVRLDLAGMWPFELDQLSKLLHEEVFEVRGSYVLRSRFLHGRQFHVVQLPCVAELSTNSRIEALLPSLAQVLQ